MNVCLCFIVFFLFARVTLSEREYGRGIHYGIFLATEKRVKMFNILSIDLDYPDQCWVTDWGVKGLDDRAFPIGEHYLSEICVKINCLDGVGYYYDKYVR